MAFLFGPTVRNDICSLVRTRSAGAALQVWGTTNFTGTKLAEFTLGSPAFNTPTNGTIVATTIAPTIVLATGEGVAWRILEAGTSILILKGTMGGPDSGADWEIETEDALILQNQSLAILSFSYTAPL
jgi:hypothetical protein